jgi:hypothetical protein
MASISLKYKSKSGNLTAPGDVDPGAMIPLATTTLSSNTASVTFSDIPQNYEHLQIRVLARTNRASAQGDYIKLNFNSDTAANYAGHELSGWNGSALSAANTSVGAAFVNRFAAANQEANAFGAGIIDILDYANTGKYTTVRSVAGWADTTAGNPHFNSALWQNTSAITSIAIIAGGGTLINQYSHFALYGIKRAGA